MNKSGMDTSIIHKFMLLIAAICTTFSVSAYDFEVDGIYYEKISDTSVEVTNDGNLYDDNSAGYSGNVTIPETIEINGITYFVCGIGEGAFSGCISLTSVSISEGVISIDNYAFSGCAGLTSVAIPASVTSIGESAFKNCTGLASISIPEGVTSIGDFAFRSCSGLTSVAIPASVTSIANGTFRNCTGLASVSIPASVTSIGDDAFRDCTSLTSFTIPEGVTSIGNDAFRGCNGLTSVAIPASVTSIGLSAFSDCPCLSEIIINNNNPNYASINGVLFNKTYTELILCSTSKAGLYNIPEGVTSISLRAFYGCTGLTSVTIPASVTSIGEGAFWGCTGLTSVAIPASVTSIEEDTFLGCTGLTSVTIPEGVTSISRRAFYGCTGLTSVTIPASVTYIGISVFDICSGLTEIIINENNPNYASNDGVLFNKTYTELILCPVGKAGIYNIPDGVTSISHHAFYGCTGLTSVIIPESVTSIGNQGIYYCLALNRIICLADTVPTFGYAVFAGLPTTCSFYVPSGTGGSYASVDELAYYTIKELGLTVTPAEVTLEVGATAELTASYTVDGAAETETEISSVLGSEFIWSSSDENVAAVSTSGQVTARNAGTAEIKAITRFGNTVFATSNVNVGTSGILDVSTNGIKISAASGKIMVENLGENQKVSAYTIDGVCHILQGSNDGTVEIPAETGKIYIIVVDGFATKVIAK